MHPRCCFGEYFTLLWTTQQKTVALLLTITAWFAVKTPVQLPDGAKDIHHSNSISKPFQQGCLQWLPTMSSSHEKCISQKVTMQPINHMKHTLIHVLTLYQHLKGLEAK